MERHNEKKKNLLMNSDCGGERKVNGNENGT
jgi:hypothetical protein